MINDWRDQTARPANQTKGVNYYETNLKNLGMERWHRIGDCAIRRTNGGVIPGADCGRWDNLWHILVHQAPGKGGLS